jgi:hypothetical protein
VRGSRPDHPSRAGLINTYERALVSMHKMPRIWLDYLELLLEGGGVTGTRRAFDRALAALPITQHERVWVLYLVRWGAGVGVGVWVGCGGLGWDGMGWDGMGWDGMGWDGMGWSGIGTRCRAVESRALAC